MKLINQLIIKTTGYIIITILVISISTYGISFFFENFFSHSYFLGVIDKHEIFKKRNSRNNLIIIGGSSNAFGIDSKEMQQALHVPVINLGVNAAFGAQFYFSEAKKEAKSGDIVLANLEYETTTDSFRYGGIQLYQMFFESHFKGLCYANIGHYYNSFFQMGNITRRNILYYINKKGVPDFNPTYNREAFDENGDLQNQPFKGKYKNGHINLFYPSDYFISTITEFNEYCKNNNIKLLYSFPPIAKSTYNSKKATELYNMLLKANIAVINKPENSVYNDSLFVVTYYHLCKEGRYIYTSKLIGDLKLINRKAR